MEGVNATESGALIILRGDIAWEPLFDPQLAVDRGTAIFRLCAVWLLMWVVMFAPPHDMLPRPAHARSARRRPSHARPRVDAPEADVHRAVRALRRSSVQQGRQARLRLGQPAVRQGVPGEAQGEDAQHRVRHLLLRARERVGPVHEQHEVDVVRWLQGPGHADDADVPERRMPWRLPAVRAQGSRHDHDAHSSPGSPAHPPTHHPLTTHPPPTSRRLPAPTATKVSFEDNWVVEVCTSGTYDANAGYEWNPIYAMVGRTKESKVIVPRAFSLTRVTDDRLAPR